ncbi:MULTISPECIES: Hvo_1808 family surface protein [unclassified Haladaptatus]|uniref:Hvo_1808 family surface protein n=1 Tax=unclassified Haladaptatus TaxID=2622732 RepID=UPI0023E8C8C4|nr:MULTISPECIES: Hvo_1808 family surface protein [unclassified Haladaptatus]
MRRAIAVVGLALLLVLSGCVGGFFGPRDAPDDDTIGWENGYWYDDPLAVDESDGLNETEREAVVSRTMARVEVIRQLEFKQSVPVNLITRDEYRAQRGGNGGTIEQNTYQRWNEQVWEALFLVDEEATVDDAFGGVFGSAVQGYYGGGEITLVSDSETPMVDRTTLSHELVHALQDQHFGLSGNRDTQDGELAYDGLIEGDANYVESLYEQRCQAEWDCLDRPERNQSGSPDDFNRGVFSAIYQPYADGPRFVDSLRESGGWEAVNDAYDAVPQSTEQVIHPEDYPEDTPVEISIPDRSSNAWSRFTFENRPDYDTVGEASIYAMLWANGVAGDQSAYTYTFPASTGWAGDRVVPYHNDGEYGYVWVTEWETETDAQEFNDAYLQVLENNGATERSSGVYRIPDSQPYGDAFRVTLDGTRVKIVNAPTEADLSGIDG